MTTIALHKYSQKIEQLIAENQFDEAIDHCRHILQQHPRHVDTYRTLAKAYLERGSYSDAVDLIQRILSADPSDMMAHVGLSIAYKEQSKLDQSIWHLERALDVEPYSTPLREELTDLYTLKKSTLPDSMAPSSAALARIYLKSEMYHAAIAELRHALAQEPDRIDLKVLLAETLYWANQRVEAVSLSLEILDVLPNCIPVNAILADIWLQTGRVAEAQAYLLRLQTITLLDKAQFDPETAVGRAFIARGAPPIPDEVIVEQFGADPLLEPESETAVIAMIDSDWIEEFSMEDTAEQPADEAVEEEEDEGVSGWLLEAALSTGEDFTTQPLTMPSDPLETDTDWFIDAVDEDDESLDDLLGDVGGDDAQLDDWLTDLAVNVSDPLTDEPQDEDEPSFTGMLTGLLDSELEVVDDTAVPLELTDLLADMPEPQTEDVSVLNLAELAELDLDQFLADENDESPPQEEAAQSLDDSFAEGLTALFSDMDRPDSAIADSLDKTDDTGLDEFLASDLETLAKADEEDERTGYTQLFDQLSTDAFPEELEEPEALDSDWLTPAIDTPAPDLPDSAEDAEVPDWLSEIKQDAFEPVQIDPKLTVDWLSGPDTQDASADETGQSDWLTALPDDEPEMAALAESDWLAELAEGSSSEDKDETAVPDSQPPDSDDLSGIPTWMLDDEQAAQIMETPAPIDFAESVGFDTDELEEDTAVPTWLLGGDKTSEETGMLDESAPLDDIILPDSARLRENPQTILAGEELPDWLREPESEQQDEPATSEPLQTDSMMELVNQELPDWLTGELPELDQPEEPEAAASDPLSTDSMADLVSGDLPSWLLDDEPDVAARPIPEPDSELDLYKDDINIPDWLLADFATGQDQAEVAVTGDKKEQEPIPPQEPAEPSESSFEPGDDDSLGWLEELAAAAEEPAELTLEDEAESASYASRVAAGEGGAVDELPTQVSMPDELPDFVAEPDSVEEHLSLDRPQTKSEMEDVLAGVTGELNADLDWLDSLAEESAAATEPAAGDLDDFDSGTGWLDDLPAAGDTGSLAELGSKPILPDFVDSLGVLPEEPEDNLDWLSELEEGAESEIEAAAPEDIDDAMAWLEGLAARQGARLEELPSMADDDIAVPDSIDETASEAPDTSLEWLEELTEDVIDDADGSLDLALEGDLAPVDASLDWLDEMPETEEAAAELPEEEPEETVEAAWAGEVPDDNIDDALVWLDALAEEQTPPDEELAELVDETAVSDPLAPVSDSPVLAAEPAVDDTPADLDDAMSWLEDLAAEQDTPLEDMPTIAGIVDEALFVEPQAETAPQPEAPLDELAEALDWLEQLALKDSGPLVDVPVRETAVSGSEDDLAAALDWLDQLAQPEEIPERPADDIVDLADLSDEMPEDPDEALAWLQQVAAEQEEFDDTELAAKDEDELAINLFDVPQAAEPETVEPVVDEPEVGIDAAPAAALEEPAAVETEDDILAEMPDDPDAAMAWLEQLAARQGAKLEELPTVSAGDMPVVVDEPAPEAEVLPDLADTLADVAPDTDEDLPEADLSQLEIPEDLDDAMVWLEETLAAQQRAKLEELPALSGTDEVSSIPDDEPAEDESSLPEEIEGALPDWLDADSDSLAEMSGQTQWLSELDEPDIEGWLDEEETTISNLYDDSIQSRAAPLADSTFETGPLSLSGPAISDADLFDMPEDEVDKMVFSLDDEKLAAARQAVANGMFDEALQTYQTLVDAGGGMMTLIADLETVAVEQPDQPLFCHLLGDAYMRNGQLQKALDTYRIALDQI